MKTELAFTRYCITQEVVLRATDDAGASVRNLDESELDDVKSALIGAGFNVYGKPSPTFFFSLKWKTHESGKKWTSNFFQNTFEIQFIESVEEGAWYQVYLNDENGNEKETIGCHESMQGIKDIVEDWIKLQIDVMGK